jgi:hypothetical protein
VGIGTTNPVQTLQIGDVTIPDSEGMIRLASRAGIGSAYRAWNIGVPEAGNNTTGTGYSFVIDDVYTTNTTEFMVKFGTGYVGIGTANPKASLHVKGVGRAATGNANYFNNSFANLSPTLESQDIFDVVGYFEGSLVAKGSVASQNVTSWSDARAKTIIGRSSGAEDLATLDRIQITDYRWIDSRNGGPGIQKKVIAQEVEAVLPQAVSRLDKAIPNIFKKASELAHDATRHRLTVSLSQPHDLQPGDRVDVYTDAGDLTKTPVLDTPTSTTFSIECKTKPKEAFVYGKWVKDYRSVDYDAIAMLNVSATQELHRRLAAAEAEVRALKSSLAKVALREETRQNRLASLEALVESLVASNSGQRAADLEAASPAPAPAQAASSIPTATLP